MLIPPAHVQRYRQYELDSSIVVKVYIDNSVLSRIYDARLSKSNADAIEKLSEISEGEVLYVTSEQTLKEMMATSDAKRRAVLRLIFRLAPKVPMEQSATFVPATLGSFALGAMALGGGAIAVDPLLLSLQQIFRDAEPEGDPVHIFQAIRSGCDYFLTLDDPTILEPARAHRERLVGLGVTMAFVDPVQLANDLSGTDS